MRDHPVSGTFWLIWQNMGLIFGNIWQNKRLVFCLKINKKPKKIIILGPWKFEKNMRLFGDFLILQWLEPWVKFYKIFMKVLTYHYSFAKTSKSLEHKQPQNYDFLVQPFSIKVNDFSHAFPQSPTWFNNCNMTHL